MLGLTSRRARWALPVVVAAVVAVGAQVSARAADRRPDLPTLTTQQLLVKVATSRVSAFSGTVRSTTDLGFPALPQQAGVDWSSLLTGTQTLRVYADGPRRQRVDLLGQLTQASVVHDGSTLWTWNSATRQVTRTVVPADRGGSSDAARDLPPAASLTPQQVAERALAAVDPTTKVAVGPSATVAGRSAYDLRIEPRAAVSLVQRVDVFVDARTGLVLRAVVTARGGGAPAVDVGFTRLSLGAPLASAFRFTPPPGSKVRDVAPPSGPVHDGARTSASGARVLGQGWASVLELSGTPSTATPGTPPSPGTGVGSLLGPLARAARPVHGAAVSGRLLSTRLVSVLQTDDGHVYVGAVTPAELLRRADAAARQPAR